MATSSSLNSSHVSEAASSVKKAAGANDTLRRIAEAARREAPAVMAAAAMAPVTEVDGVELMETSARILRRAKVDFTSTQAALNALGPVHLNGVEQFAGDVAFDMAMNYHQAGYILGLIIGRSLGQLSAESVSH